MKRRVGRLAWTVAVGMVLGLIGVQALHAQPDTRTTDERAIREPYSDRQEGTAQGLVRIGVEETG